MQKIHRNNVFWCARRVSPSRALETPHRDVSAPRDVKRGARAVRIPLFYCPIKSAQNKKSSTPQGAALGATGRIRTSGLPGRRTTTGQYRQTLYREFCWFCTFAAKTGKSPLLVVTTGFSGILWCRCTVVVKWWSGYSGRHYIFGT